MSGKGWTKNVMPEGRDWRILMKIKKLLAALWVIALLAALGVIAFWVFLNGCACENGNGNIVSRERPVSDFFGVILDGVGDINIYYAENCRVEVTTDSNIQGIIKTQVNGNNLHIENTTRAFYPTKLTIDVYMPELRNINLKGAGNIDAQNCEAENVVVVLSGIGDIKTWVTKSITVDISGSGNVLYKGNPRIITTNRDITGDVIKL
jgi:hypothetical protein